MENSSQKLGRSQRENPEPWKMPPNWTTICRFPSRPAASRSTSPSCGCLRDQLHPWQVPVRLPRVPHAHDELRLLNIWQIRQARPEDFQKGLIGFGKDIEKSLLGATSPFVFSTVKESSILRLLKLIACDNGKIGTYAKLVDDRNKTAHTNGHIFFSTQSARRKTSTSASASTSLASSNSQHSRTSARCTKH